MNDNLLYKNKYRIPSARAQWWDYSKNGEYFITICTANREHLFGKIENQQMILSEIGRIVEQEWEKSFVIRAELFCNNCVIMPNHIHALLHIDTVQTHGRASLPAKNTGVAYRPPKSISSFVGGFKSAATKRINILRQTPGTDVWQDRFHDHIVRDNDEYQRIYDYITTNPQNWKSDKFFT